MSEGLVRCLKFLAFILIIFHAEALTYNSFWERIDGQHCYWRRNKDKYEVIHKNNDESSLSHASLTNEYKIDGRDPVPGNFCIELRTYHFLSLDLVLAINSETYPIHELQTTKCRNYYTSSSFKVSISVTCESSFPPLSNPAMIFEAKVEEPSKTTTTSTPPGNENPTTDVGDIQYVGVVVGAICIALFTLFSCLTIISARRSNQRESRGRTVPSASCQEEDDNRPDVVADNAPPSYDAVMACPDMYPPTPQDTPHVTPDTTPHLSLHRRALLNQQQLGSLPSSVSVTPQLNRRSFTPTVTSDEWDDVPEYPPPPYPGLANGEVAIPIPEDATDSTTDAPRPGIENPGISQPESENSRASSPAQNSSPDGNDENPWVLNNSENSHLRSRDPPSRGNTEQYPMRARTSSNDSTHSNEDSQRGSNSSSSSQVIDTNPVSVHDRNPKPGVDSETPNLGMRVAVV